MRSGRRWFAYGAAGFMLLSLTGARTEAAQTIKHAPAPRIASVEGVDSYKAYCAVCHGPNAKGDGPAAQALKKVPADLTTIAKRAGKFSEADVEAVIMGSQVLASHGSRDMPIWGPVFRAIAPEEGVMKLRVSNLVAYIKSIQTK